MSVSVAIKGNITLTDNLTGSQQLIKSVNNGYTGELASFAQSLFVDQNVYVVSVPNNLAEFVYIKNLSTVPGQYITVTWAPNTGTAATIITLDAGALIIFSENTTANGITSLSMISNSGTIPVEFILVA